VVPAKIPAWIDPVKHLGIETQEGAELVRLLQIDLHRDQDKDPGKKRDHQSFEAFSQVPSCGTFAQGIVGPCSGYQEKQGHSPLT